MDDVLIEALRECGLKRMVHEAEAAHYRENVHQLIVDLRYALTLRSLRASEIGNIGRLLRRVLAGEFGEVPAEDKERRASGG